MQAEPEVLKGQVAFSELSSLDWIKTADLSRNKSDPWAAEPDELAYTTLFFPLNVFFLYF